MAIGISNKLSFPITGGLEKSSGTSVTKGLDKVHNPNTVTGGLEIVKR